MRIAVSVEFAKFLKKHQISDASILKAASEIASGLVDARLGDFLFKKRLPRAGQGKRGGYRTILVFVKDDRCLFLYGYEKSRKSDLTPEELDMFRFLASQLARADFDKLLSGKWQAIGNDDDP